VPILNSSCIRRAEYDSGTLYLTFVNGKTYPYYNVPGKIYIDLINSDSPGGFYKHYVSRQYGNRPHHPPTEREAPPRRTPKRL